MMRAEGKLLDGRKLLKWFKKSVICTRIAVTAKKAQTLVEYAIIVAWVALVVIVMLTLLGGQIKNFFNQTTNNLQSVSS